MKIVVVGSINMDLVVRMPRIPNPGETLLGGRFKTFPGGKGANQAVAAARLGANVVMVGCVGDDAFGREMLDTFNREGIDASRVKVLPDEATGVALIQVDGTGQNSIAVASGANYRLVKADIITALEGIGNFDVLVMPFEIPDEAINSAAKIASGRGARVVINPAPARMIGDQLLAITDVLIPNEFELALIAGMETKTEDGIIQAAAKMLSYGLKSLVVTLGNKGAMLFDEGSIFGTYIPACPVKAVDSTAAGDCFVGAVAVGLCEGKPLRAALEFAAAAAAISVTREGAQPSLPNREEVLKFLSSKKDSHEKNWNH